MFHSLYVYGNLRNLRTHVLNTHEIVMCCELMLRQLYVHSFVFDGTDYLQYLPCFRGFIRETTRNNMNALLPRLCVGVVVVLFRRSMRCWRQQ